MLNWIVSILESRGVEVRFDLGFLHVQDTTIENIYDPYIYHQVDQALDTIICLSHLSKSFERQWKLTKTQNIWDSCCARAFVYVSKLTLTRVSLPSKQILCG